MYTPSRITKLEPNQIFVFGSNYAGRHGKGAALTAVNKFGARHGQGTGIMGRSYGIATKDHNLNILPLHKIQIQVERFIRFAIDNPTYEFLVTEIGCGLSKYRPKDIAPFFAKSPVNVILPESFVRHNNLLNTSGLY